MQYKKNTIYLSRNTYRNVLTHDRVFYRIELLNPKFAKSRGGNSSVFKLVDSNTEREYAIKLFKYPLEENVNENILFEKEIEALNMAKKKLSENIVEIYFDGQMIIDGKTFRYYVMEKAKYDLREFILNNNVAISQKILLCYELIKGVKELHSIDIYHRDIKPDNIFFISNNGRSTWKIGDLGLIAYRGEDLKQIEYQKKVGPVGWLSPEAVNKIICEGTKYEAINNCKIDTHSDIFQLGQVFWFIFKFCAPTGQVYFTDFNIDNEILYKNILRMIQHKKSRRKSLEYFKNEFYELAS